MLLHDRETGTTTEVSVRPDGTSGTADSTLPSISADGRYATFFTDTEMVPEDTNRATDAYRIELATGSATRP